MNTQKAVGPGATPGSVNYPFSRFPCMLAHALLLASAIGFGAMGGGGVVAAEPVRPSPVDIEKDQQSKLLLQEKINRELEDNRKKSLENSRKKSEMYKGKSRVLPPDVEPGDTHDSPDIER